MNLDLCIITALGNPDKRIFLGCFHCNISYTLVDLLTFGRNFYFYFHILWCRVICYKSVFTMPLPESCFVLQHISYRLEIVEDA